MFSRTERLLLRPGWAEDAPALHRAWDDAAITRNLPDLPCPVTEQDALDFLSRDRDTLSPYFLLFARTGGSPRLIGGCGIIGNETANNTQAELSFWIARPFWGLGFATEAASAVTHMARASGIGQLVARPTSDNSAASNILFKLGFRPTGQVETRHCPARGTDVSCALFADSEITPLPCDSSQELYMDRAPIAA